MKEQRDTVWLPDEVDVIAPDGSEVRVLTTGQRGSMAHFRLGPGETSVAVRHRSIEELWFVVQGRARFWRGGVEPGVVEIGPGASLCIAPGVPFQFSALGDEPFEAIGVAMPPWPTERTEADVVPGPWPPTVGVDPL